MRLIHHSCSKNTDIALLSFFGSKTNFILPPGQEVSGHTGSGSYVWVEVYCTCSCGRKWIESNWDVRAGSSQTLQIQCIYIRT